MKPLFVVVGDLGEYTQDTLDTINVCLCFGFALSAGMGGILAGAKNVLVTGYGAYLRSGKNVIPVAIKRGVLLRVIIICNGGLFNRLFKEMFPLGSDRYYYFNTRYGYW